MRCRFYIFILIFNLFAPCAWAVECTDLFVQSGVPIHSFHTTGGDLVQKEIQDLYSSMGLRRIEQLAKDITYEYGQKEMSFQVKNPATGNYDKFVSVPVNPRVALINSKSFNKMIRSTEPVMRALRNLLQKIYSAPKLDAEALGLTELPPAESEIFLSVIRESIYLEPQLRGPEMRAYPFLSVAGFDGALGDPNSPQPKFYEMNLGTPSGLSNNILLRDTLFKLSPTLESALKDKLVQDDTFRKLRHAIESNAFAWTGLTSGISVVISPGIYNGAHPDVAAIARLTGMPLVKSSDLYEDSSGYIRLNTGFGSNHPVVTGIYGRMEESFFLQSNELQVPMVSPNYMHNKELGERLGISLKNGVIYQFIYDELGKIQDVERDEDGKAIIASVFDSIGQDPRNLSKKPGNFVAAIKSRKLYYSALGGRVVDDKRLFGLVSKYLAGGGDSVAQPVSSVSIENLHLVFENPKKYVVKEPANSGGTGIYFLGQMPDNDRNQILEKLKLHPENFEVQELAEPTTLLQVARKSNGQLEEVPVLSDLRFFVMMDGDGDVSAGANSMLLRTAPEGQLYSNTSRGGGYGIAMVYQLRSSADKKLMRTSSVARVSISSQSRNVQIQNFLNQFEESIYLAKSGSDNNKLQELARDMSFSIREVMDLVPEKLVNLASLSRALADLPIESIDSHLRNRYLHDLIEYLAIITDSSAFSSEAAAQISESFIRSNSEKWILELNVWPISRKILGSRVELEALAQPESAFEKIEQRHTPWARTELAKYTKIEHYALEALRIEIEAAGGELRYMRRLNYGNGQVLNSRWEPAYFWVNYSMPNLTSYMKPIIAIDLTSRGAFASLSHEMSHFREWKSYYDQLRAEGLDHESATKTAVQKMESEEGTLVGERAALKAEIEAEHKFKFDRFNESRDLPTNDDQFGFVNRWVYPEFEATRRALLKLKTNKMLIEESESAKRYMKQMLEYALLLKKKALALKTKDYDQWQAASLIELIALPYGIERLELDRTFPLFIYYYRECLKDLGLPDDFNPQAFMTAYGDEIHWEEQQASGQQ